MPLNDEPTLADLRSLLASTRKTLDDLRERQDKMVRQIQQFQKIEALIQRYARTKGVVL
jgi:cell division protein FtsB